MKYKIQNTSTNTTVWIDAYNQGNAFPLLPGKICSVPEHTKTQIINGNPTILVDLGPVTDTGAPASPSIGNPVAASGTWTLITMGPGDKFYSNFRLFASTNTVQVSFSGWDISNSEVAPPLWAIIDVPLEANTLIIEEAMDPTNGFYVKGTGNLTVIAY